MVSSAATTVKGYLAALASHLTMYRKAHPE